MFLPRCLLLMSIFGLGFCLSINQKVESNHTEKSNRIVGGFETTIEKNPWQVSLQDHRRLTCGGSIIGNNWILTAAHCTCHINKKSIKLTVRFGSSFHANGGFIGEIKRIVEHEDFDDCDNEDDVDYDYSLLELVKPLKFTKQIQPIALPNSDTEIADGTISLVSGWGLTQVEGKLSKKLRAVYVPIVNQSYCTEQYEEIEWRVTDRMICAGYDEGLKDACNGDSGGPLVAFKGNGTPELIGVVSTGVDCAIPKFPGIYSRVTRARSWIRKVTGI